MIKINLNVVMLQILWFRYDSRLLWKILFAPCFSFPTETIMVWYLQTFSTVLATFWKYIFQLERIKKSFFFKSCNLSSRNWFICFLSNQVLKTNASLCYLICSSGLKSNDLTDILLRVAPLRLLHNWLILQLCLNTMWPGTKIMM